MLSRVSNVPGSVALQTVIKLSWRTMPVSTYHPSTQPPDQFYRGMVLKDLIHIQISLY